MRSATASLLAAVATACVIGCAGSSEGSEAFGPNSEPVAITNASTVDGGAPKDGGEAKAASKDGQAEAGSADGAPSPSAADATADAQAVTDAGSEAAVPEASVIVLPPIALPSVGVVRAYAAGLHFYTTSATEATNAGLVIEANPYFYAATERPAASTFAALHRCVASNGAHLYTTAADCEGSGLTFEADMGYVATTPVCGAVALHRLYNGTDHLYTVSAAEAASAQGVGYVFEGIAGYVWSAPQIECPRN